MNYIIIYIINIIYLHIHMLILIRHGCLTVFEHLGMSLVIIVVGAVISLFWVPLDI